MASEIPTYPELAACWRELRATHDIRLREVACVGAPRTLLCADYGDPGLPMVLLAAGVHGDEPAGALALLELVRRNALDPRFAYRIWPCTNPTGFEAGTRESADGLDINRTFGRGGLSPEARAIVTANRDYKFALALDFHEDCDAAGFYCYEYGATSAGEHAIAAVARSGEPCATVARLRPDPAAEAQEIGGLSLILSLIRHAASAALTFESPTARPLAARVDAHIVAAQTALSQTIVK